MTITNVTAEQVRKFITQGEDNLSTGMYNDNADGKYPTHGLGINFQGKTDAFLKEYITYFRYDINQPVNHYVYNDETKTWETDGTQKTLFEEIKWLCNSSNSINTPFKHINKTPIETGIPLDALVRLVTSPEQNNEVFDNMVYDAFLNSKYGITGVISNVGDTIWSKLTDTEQLALFSLNYNLSTLIGPSLKNALKLYTTDSTTESKMIGKLSAWYEILYGTNGGTDKKGVQNRRFMEANAFLGTVNDKITEGVDGSNNSKITITTFEEAKAAIIFMNSYSSKMISNLSAIDVYSLRANEIVQNNFSEAIKKIFSEYNVKYDENNLKTLFTEWNVFTDLKLSLNSENKLSGETEHQNVSGSYLKDFIFFTSDDSNHTISGNGGFGDDTYVISKNFKGNIVIDDSSGTDKIVFEGLEQKDVSFIKAYKTQIISLEL